MSNDARLRQKWKVDLLSYIKPFRDHLSKPVNKLISEVVYGILGSGSLKTPQGTFSAFGIHLVSEIARALKEDVDLHHTSKRLSRMLVKHKLQKKVEAEVLCRMKSKLNDNMILAWRGKTLDAQEIAKRLPCKHRCKLRRHGDAEVTFGLTTVHLPSHPDKPLTLIVVRHGKKEPMVLVSTRRAYGRRQGQALIHAYMDRWCVEEGFRFSKQGFGLEGVMARKMNVLKTLSHSCCWHAHSLSILRKRLLN